MLYTAGSLDGRNVNSIITISHRGRTTIGSIATIEHIGSRTEIFLAHGEDAISLPSAHQVQINLDPAANSAFYTTKAVQSVVDLLQGIATPAAPDRQGNATARAIFELAAKPMPAQALQAAG